jgi:hypothetical protein
MAVWVGLLPVIVACIVLVITFGLEAEAQGPGLCSGFLFLSLGAILIQSPAFIGRVELRENELIVLDRALGKKSSLSIPRQQIQRAYFAPLTRPAAWLPYFWAAVQVVFIARALVTSTGGGVVYWYWLTAFVGGLSFWPLMIARWKASSQVILLYDRPHEDQPGFIHAWTTPHQASSLVNTLQGLIDWQDPKVAD